MTRRRAGFALAAALFALGLAGALIAALFLSARQESAAARRGLLDARAFSAAERGLRRQAAAWDPARNPPAPDGMAVGESRASDADLALGDRARVVATRLSPELFLLSAEGRSGGVAGAGPAASVRRTALALRLARRLSTPRAAVTAAGAVALAPGALVDGSEHLPPGWLPCASALPRAVPDLAAAEGALVPSPETPAWRELAAAGAGPYVTYAPASLRLDGARVRGVLIVEGDLELAGGAEVAGIALVRGAVRGSGAVYGALVMHGAAGEIAAGVRVLYSSCAVRAALDASARLTPMPRRAWIQNF